MKKTLLGGLLMLAYALAWALPTLQRVETEVQQGHYAQAETMMSEVIAAKPGSAKAHYIYAEILAHNGDFAKAAEQADKAQVLDPDLKFTQPEKFTAFQKLLQREQNPLPRTDARTSLFPATAPAAAAPARASGIPGWVWLAGLGVVGYLLWRGFSRSQGGATPNGSYGMPAATSNGYGTVPAGGYGTPYPSAATASPGGGLLKTGLAVAGGVAAGMMVDELLHRHQGTGVDQLSGLQHGILDTPQPDGVARELERRDVDFGNGNDWDAGGSGTDVGGGGSDDDGWG